MIDASIVEVFVEREGGRGEAWEALCTAREKPTAQVEVGTAAEDDDHQRRVVVEVVAARALLILTPKRWWYLIHVTKARLRKVGRDKGAVRSVVEALWRVQQLEVVEADGGAEAAGIGRVE